MSTGPVEPGDLLDLKLLPSWLKESAPAPSYEHYEGEVERGSSRRDGDDRRGRGGQAPRPGGRGRDARPGKEGRGPRRQGQDKRPSRERRTGPAPDDHQRREAQEKAVQELAARVAVRFLPHPPVLESVAAQVKSNPLAYSVFALARLFLEKPERYDVRLTTKPETPLFQIGEDGAVSVEREILESNAFRLAQGDFYKVEVTQGDPIKGNFTTVARCRASGTLLGPTNHHAYQPKLRSLYEQRFSRRMSFPEYQRQIEIVSDPAVVEQWKEEARSITTYTTLREEPPLTFQSAADTERHFRQNYLPGLVRPVNEPTIGGVNSRQLSDRLLRRLIEDAWSRETRSPSQVMQELSNRFREESLHIFRHRRGMLFVTSVRVRPFTHEQAGVSAHVQAILQTVAAHPGMHRKDLADKILVDVPAEEVEARKLGLASDLRWLVSEGYVIEFNDGSLDLPRVKAKPALPAAEQAKVEETGSAESGPVEAPTGDQLEVPDATIVGSTESESPAAPSPALRRPTSQEDAPVADRLQEEPEAKIGDSTESGPTAQEDAPA
ncbi:MAG TPA: hypothetical protein VGG94_07835 [Chthoniobacterales bacterium]